MRRDLLNFRRICLIFEGVEADEPAMVSEQSQASHSKVTKASLVMTERALFKLFRFVLPEIVSHRRWKTWAGARLSGGLGLVKQAVSASRAGKIGSAGVGVLSDARRCWQPCFFTNSLARASNHLRRTPRDQAPGGCPALIGPKVRDNLPCRTAAAESSQE